MPMLWLALATALLQSAPGVGGHGVVAILRGGRPGLLVAYRADMDAVPSTEPDPSAIKSETPGVRHIKTKCPASSSS